MSRWHELAEKRRRAHADQIYPAPIPIRHPRIADSHRLQAAQSRAPDTPTPKMPKMPKIEPANIFDKFGNSCTGDGRRNAGATTFNPAALWPFPLSDGRRADALPDPTDLLERASVLEVDGVPRHEADRQVLNEVGYASWEGLASAWRDAIGRSVVGLPPQGMKKLSSRHLTGLIIATGEFCGGRHFPSALANGWALEDLFAVDPIAPLVRLDRWGLIPALALSVVPAQVLAIHRDAAELRCVTGAIQQFHRRVPDGAVLWWWLP
jgi:hypothetical protein